MRKLACIALILLVVRPALQAQKRPLSLDEAIAVGLGSSPGLHASRMKADSAAAKTREVNATRLPALKLGAGYTRLSEVPPFAVTLPISPEPIVVSQNYFNSWSLKLSVQQPLFTGFRLEAGTAAARMLEQSAGQDFYQDRSDFAFAVKNAYWGLARAREFESVIAETIRQVQEHLKDVRAFFDQGLLTKDEVLRAGLQLSNAELLAIDARSAVDVARASLNVLIGLPVETDVELTTSAESLAASTPTGEEDAVARTLIDTALAGRPDIKSAEFRIKASEAGVKAAKSGWYPQIALAGNLYQMRPNPRLLPARDSFYATWDIGLALSLDIWNWGQTKSQTEQAKAQLAQARDAHKLLEDQAVVEVTQSRLALVQARDKARVAGEAVGQAEENLRVIREQFRMGLARNSDVLDGELLFLQTRISKAQAAIDVVLAQARLEKALGR
jgi:outer membrane protein